jgi:hypothetical protein
MVQERIFVEGYSCIKKHTQNLVLQYIDEQTGANTVYLYMLSR